eukprot:scaffold22374_cov48-Phaeocystis_antarctica.AAC.1
MQSKGFGLSWSSRPRLDDFPRWNDSMEIERPVLERKGFNLPEFGFSGRSLSPIYRCLTSDSGARARSAGASPASGAAEQARMPDALLEAVRGLWLADPELGPKPLLAKLREQQPDLGAGNKEVREALKALKAESEAKEAAAAAAPPAAATPLAAAAPPAADVGGAPLPASLAPSLACFGCARLPSEMGDDREKHEVCPICVKLKVPTTYWCCVNCPGNPGAWKRHAVYHKGVKRHRKLVEDGGVVLQRVREIAEEAAQMAAQSGDEYEQLMAEGTRYGSQQDTRRAARAFREAIALRPDWPAAYFNLGAALGNSGHYVEAAQRYLEAKERYPVGSENWAVATAAAFTMLSQDVCAEVAKPEWWNDEGLKALSARLVRLALNDGQTHEMRADVLDGRNGAWEVGPRSAAELKEAATHYDRAAALHPAPAAKADLAGDAEQCRRLAELLHTEGCDRSCYTIPSAKVAIPADSRVGAADPLVMPGMSPPLSPDSPLSPAFSCHGAHLDL